MTVLITGAAGFIGRRLTATWNDSPVYGIDTAAVPDAKLHYIGDLADAPAIETFVKHIKPSVIVHLAALSTTGGSDATIAANVAMTPSLLEQLLEFFRLFRAQAVPILLALFIGALAVERRHTGFVDFDMRR